MSKERWLEAYEQVYNEMPEGTSEDLMAQMATEREADIEARRVDEAMDRLGDKVE